MHSLDLFDFDPQLFADGGDGGSPAPEGGAPAPAPTDQPDAGNPAPSDPEPSPEGSNPAPENNPFDFPPEEGAPVVPEKYEFNLPEGLEMTPEIESKFTEVAKSAGLTQAQADSLVKIHSDIVMGIRQSAEKIRNDWAAECRKQGLATDVNLRSAKLAVDTFGGGEAMTALVESGVAFHPAVQRMLQNIGNLLSEDNVPEGTNAGGKPSAADLLFANSKY